MEALVADVSWAAVVVGAILAYVLGMLWYSPKLFGKAWMKGSGISPDHNKPMMPAMVNQAAGIFLLAWVIGITATTNSLAFALLIAFTIAVLIKASGLFSGKNHTAVIIDATYILAMVVVMILTHAVI